jgi:Zn-dependent protease
MEGMDWGELIRQIVLAGVPVIMAITLHETAHGYAAWALGDDTAKQAGRLSLNPLRHVDRVGTVLLPGFLMVSQLLLLGRVVGVFGWAKPVPVSAWRFRNPRRGMALVAAAGPVANAVLAWLAALALHVTDALPPAAADIADQLLLYFILSNLVLGLFNLLPIPPLDGGRIMVGILPEPLALRWARLERAGIAVVLLAVFLMPRLLAEFGIAFDPVGNLLGRLVPAAMGVVLRAAGHA